VKCPIEGRSIVDKRKTITDNEFYPDIIKQRNEFKFNSFFDSIFKKERIF